MIIVMTTVMGILSKISPTLGPDGPCVQTCCIESADLRCRFIARNIVMGRGKERIWEHAALVGCWTRSRIGTIGNSELKFSGPFAKMIMRLLGLALIAYGPALALFFLSVSRSGQMVVLMMAGAFFWILSILLSSAIWYGVQQQTGRSYTAVSITVAIVCQEAFRFLFWILLRRAEPGLNQVSDYPKSKLNRLRYAFVGGLGFGLMSGLVNFITQLS
ncbi:Aph-1 protein-domain-containing protein [Zopfochytrium polystomum]|nr:Aph-1 protein-domain-containing protein [Zopfochytrium polystomum]